MWQYIKKKKPILCFIPFYLSVNPLLVTSCSSLTGLAVPRACDPIQSHYCTTHPTEAHILLPRQASETAWPAGLEIAPLSYSTVAHGSLRGFCRVMVLIKYAQRLIILCIWHKSSAAYISSMAFSKIVLHKEKQGKPLLFFSVTFTREMIKCVIAALAQNSKIYSVTNANM